MFVDDAHDTPGNAEARLGWIATEDQNDDDRVACIYAVLALRHLSEVHLILLNIILFLCCMTMQL